MATGIAAGDPGGTATPTSSPQGTGGKGPDFGGKGNNGPGGSDPWGMGQFNQALPGVNQQIGANAGQIGDMAQQAIQNGQGVDPRFAQYAGAQNNLLNFQRTGALNAAQGQFANTGMGNSSAAMNEINKINTGYDLNQQNLTGQLGLQGLQNSNQQSQFGASLLGQQNQMGNDMLQNLLANPAINVAGTAAKNAGKGGGGGGGKGAGK